MPTVNEKFIEKLWDELDDLQDDYDTVTLQYWKMKKERDAFSKALKAISPQAYKLVMKSLRETEED